MDLLAPELDYVTSVILYPPWWHVRMEPSNQATTIPYGSSNLCVTVARLELNMNSLNLRFFHSNY